MPVCGKRLRCYSLLLGAACYAGLALTARPLPRHAFSSQDRFLVFAHRGGRGLGPENTLPTFTRAVALGADVLEMDVQLTADSQLVVVHDDRVDRVTDGRGRIDQLSLEELRRLDAGYRWSSDDGTTFPSRGEGLRIPTLDEVLSAFPETRVNIEIKEDSPSTARALCGTVRRWDMADRAMVASRHTGAMGAFRDACPEVATSATEKEGYAFLALHLLRLGAAYHPTAQAFQIPERLGPLELADRRLIDALHNHGVQVHVWTVNEREAMERLLDLGVDGLITDRPDRLLEALRERDRR
jgi:glycerophosphoryl diester phosphodiesterase